MNVRQRTDRQGQHNINLHPFTQQEQAFWNIKDPDIRCIPSRRF